MAFAHLPYLPFLDSPNNLPSIDLLESLAVITPILIPLSSAIDIIKILPSHFELYVLDHHSEDSPESRLRRSAEVLKVLDLGVVKVFTDLDVELVSLGVPPDRIVKIIDGVESANQMILDSVSGVMYTLEKATRSQVTSAIESQGSSDRPRFLFDPQLDLNELKDKMQDALRSPDLVHIVSCTSITSVDIDYLADLYVLVLRTDRTDGLFSTCVVSRSPASTLLGQVYSSKESIKLSIKTRKATYYSRSRNEIWAKGATSGATQSVVRIRTDCDRDALEFQVIQKPLTGFCHTQEMSCFGPVGGFSHLESVLLNRFQNSTPGSYTNRLFNDEKLLRAKIMEEAEELCEAESHEDVKNEMADLFYFALCRCISKGVSLKDVEDVLNKRSLKITRRKGDAKPKWDNSSNGKSTAENQAPTTNKDSPAQSSKPAQSQANPGLKCQIMDLAQIPSTDHHKLLNRPPMDSKAMLSRVKPIVDNIKSGGDNALLKAIISFDRNPNASITDLIMRSPFGQETMKITPEAKEAIDIAYNNIYTFHAKQLDKERSPMVVETMEGVVCSRFARPIDRVGLYVPGGTAVLPSTALMLAIPAQVAGCPHISIATPPRPDGTISPEIMYIANRCGVKEIVKAGGAHSISAMAYGTETITKVDKIFGPGNQFVTTAKMLVASDVEASVAIDMPAGPSEVLVIADESSNPAFVAADLLSQAEHGPDSQVVLLAVNVSEGLLSEIEDHIEAQALRLPRLSIIQQSIPRSLIVRVNSLTQAFDLSNEYAPEHLILHLPNPSQYLPQIRNAGSVFLGAFSPESCGDYASGTNHSLPTMKFAKQFSGVSTLAFMKHITAQELTEDGLRRLGPTVIKLAEIEGLEAHANAVRLRLNSNS
ncbi:uncharacterized protein MELLADRAFT_72470 [Melampsora larici-populina 98AG31]|uniref:Histidine biosynthesis trifunctional protein n=1 Tax=Melampsora larici-populina (strain 98AG31 / pathotype 3-4-7) TaxID=747676 RepID=F4RUC1_MELLP|nr:uncharacterized protein MELLADRAFT_72470 [Melampsora larici-populina 98AG31]EGG04025.1 hypothetical protein MELLADRAFT_72470 [Melampsora larici-populina 98AG31]